MADIQPRPPRRLLAAGAGASLLLAGATLLTLQRAAPGAADRVVVERWGNDPVELDRERSGDGCGTCMRLRCQTGAHCGRFFVDPTGWQRPYCMCACCRSQCGLPKFCHAVPPHSTPLSRAVTVSTVAGSGARGADDADDPLAASFAVPADLDVLPFSLVGEGAWPLCLVADQANNRIRRAGPDGVLTVAGGGEAGGRDGAAAHAAFNQPAGVAVAPDGSFALVADARGNAVRRVDLDGGRVSTVAGSGEWDLIDGPGSSAAFASPAGLAVAPDGSFALVADTENDAVRRVALTGNNAVTTVAGRYREVLLEGPADGPGAEARMWHPTGVTISPDGAWAYVADAGNHAVRRVDLRDPAYLVTTIAGTGLRGADDSKPKARAATFHHPSAVALLPGEHGDFLAVADAANGLVRIVDLADCPGPGRTECWVTTAAGSGEEGGYADGVGPEARFELPGAVRAAPGAEEGDVVLMVADTGNNRLRRVDIPAEALRALREARERRAA